MQYSEIIFILNYNLCLLQESTGSQLSSSNKPSKTDIPPTKATFQNGTETSTRSKTSIEYQMEVKHSEGPKQSHSIIQRSFSNLSNKLLSTTLPRLCSSNSLKDQVPQTSKSSIARHEIVKTDDPYGEVARGLESCYKKVLLPFEEKCNFHQFHYAKYDDCEFEAKPFVLLIGNFDSLF